MADSTSQANRLLFLKTPLQADGEDVLLINSFTASEIISRMFSVELQMIVDNHKAGFVDAGKIVGKPVTLSMTLYDEGHASRQFMTKRFFNGIVNRFIEGDKDERYHYYQANVVPWSWLMTSRSDCCIFQNMDVPAIVTKIFDDLRKDYPDLVFYRNDLKSEYTKRDYCVQYRETDFNFVSRLMEEEGIFYFFEHHEDKHILVLADSTDCHSPVPVTKPGDPKIRFYSAGMGEWEDVVISWQREEALRPGKYVLRDYHFQMPDKTLLAEAPTKLPGDQNAGLEIYDYPGGYAKIFNKPDERLGQVETQGQRVVEMRMEEEEIPYKIFDGSSYCRAFCAGFRFELAGHFQDDGPYVLTSVQHSGIQSPAYVSGERAKPPYHNNFTCIPHEYPFRPSRVSLKPVMQGPQTAVVVGPEGEEIHTDKYGRVKVQFHWDRVGKKNADSSCWVRVSQVWAGKRWGASFWPRIGQEVIVDFLEGDPDHPIIVGSVYNADQMPPYLGDGPDPKHPKDNKVSGIKTNTTKGGQGFNELRFDDTKDKQQVFIHAERNMDTRVKNDSMERVVSNRHLIVGAEKEGKKAGDQFESVYRDKHLHVHRHQVEHIGGNLELLIGGGDGDGTADIAIRAKKTETIGGDNDFHVKMNRKEEIDLSTSLSVGMDQHEKVGMNHALEAGLTIHIKSGISLVIEAGAQLSLKVAGSFIDINPAGVFIQGPLVMINTGGAPGSGMGAKPQAPTDAKEAKPKDPTPADDSKTGQKSAPS